MILHSNFLDSCLKECLLTDDHLIKTITQINMRTQYFSRVIIRFFTNVEAEENADKDQMFDYEEMKDIEDQYANDSNPCIRRKEKRR